MCTSDFPKLKLGMLLTVLLVCLRVLLQPEVRDGPPKSRSQILHLLQQFCYMETLQWQ